jgi:hypothetical protein
MSGSPQWSLSQCGIITAIYHTEDSVLFLKKDESLDDDDNNNNNDMG